MSAADHTNNAVVRLRDDRVDTIGEAAAARQIWCAVIQQAIDDARQPLIERPRNFEQRRKMQERDEARAWLQGGKDFDMVCTLAGLDPVAVREKLNGLRTGNCAMGREGQGERGSGVSGIGAGDGAADRRENAY